MNFSYYYICFLALSFATVSYGMPVQAEDEEIPGEIQTQPPTKWQGAWESAKSFFSKISGYLGTDDAGTMLTRIGQATTFYNQLRENPQGLVESLKTALAQAVNQALMNPQKANQLQKESLLVQKQLTNAAASLNDADAPRGDVDTPRVDTLSRDEDN